MCGPYTSETLEKVLLVADVFLCMFHRRPVILSNWEEWSTDHPDIDWWGGSWALFYYLDKNFSQWECSFLLKLHCHCLKALQWLHNERDDVSNHRRLNCLLNRLLKHRSNKHQSSVSLAFVRGIHRWLVDSPPKGSVMWKVFPFDDVIMIVTLSDRCSKRGRSQDGYLRKEMVGIDIFRISYETCLLVNATRPHCGFVNIVLGNGLVSVGNRPLPELMMTKIYIT